MPKRTPGKSPTSCSSRSRGRPKDPAKRRAILLAAKRLFTAGGLARTSMEAVASEAGVSKITVYSHFCNKEALFRETVMAKCGEHWPDELFDVSAELPLQMRLTRIGVGFLGLVYSPKVLSMYRLLVSQSAEHNRFGQLFWEAGPDRTMRRLAELLLAAGKRGLLQVPDPRTSAAHFFSLLKGEHHIRTLVGAAGALNARAQKRHVDEVVALFLRAHGAH